MGLLHKLESDLYSCITGKQLLQDIPPMEYLVDELFPKSSINLLYAASNTGKTMFCMSAMLSVAAGIPFLGRYRAVTGKTLILDWESRPIDLIDRTQQLSRGLGLMNGLTPVGDWPTRLALKSPVPFTVKDPKYIEHMKRMCDGVSFVVLDSLRALTPGLDENDSRMREPIDALRQVNDYTTFVILHHPRKLPVGESFGKGDDVGRGSNAPHEAADLAYYMATQDGVVTVTQKKHRRGKKAQETVLDFRIQSDWNGKHSNWIRLESVPW